MMIFCATFAEVFEYNFCSHTAFIFMKSLLSERAQKVLKTTFGDTFVVQWERPTRKDHGDIATSIALQIAKKVGKNPKEIAELLASALWEEEGVERVDVAGAGYVNVWLTPDALIALLDGARQACTAKVKNAEAPVVIEYSGPNIAKPLGIHHILSTVVGQAIANLYEHQGYDVKTVNHIGDWGTQFGKLFVAYQNWKKKPIEDCTVEDLLDLYVRFHDEAEANPALDDQAREAFARLEKGDKDMKEFWQTSVDISMRELLMMYERLHVDIAYQHAESMYEEMMMPLIEKGKKDGVFIEGKEGALIAEFPEELNMPPAIVLKADGATIYHTRDLATIRYRTDTWHPQAVYHVVDIAQQLYFQQLICMGNQLFSDLPHWEHIIIGRMRFADKGMSTRKGNIVRLEQVLDEAVERARKKIEEHGEKIQTDDIDDLAEMMGVSSVAYGVLSQNRRMDMVFDWDTFLSFDGNSAPYLQYTHARSRSVLDNAGVETVEKPKKIQSLSEKERGLINTIMLFEQVLEDARREHMPHKLANFLFELCQEFNAFYSEEPILKAEEPERSLRLYLTYMTASVLQAGARILTIRVPDRM